MNQLSPEAELARRYSDTRTLLLSKLPFYGFMLMQMHLRIGDAEVLGVKTAAVSRDRQVFFHLGWSGALPDPEFVGVSLHELSHLVLGIFERMGLRDPERANEAHDHVVNLGIEELRASSPTLAKLIRLPQPCLCDPQYKGMSFEEVYARLPPKNGKGGSGGSGSPQWGVGDLRPDLGESAATAAEQDRAIRQMVIEAALHQERVGHGHVSSGMKLLIHEILNPRVPWQEVLSQWVGQHGRQLERSYRRLARRAQAVGYTSPSSFKSGVCDVVVLWDTSGSMGDRKNEIFAELFAICDDLGLTLRVICCDSSICSDQSNVTSPEDIDVKGGGGSDFRPAFARLDDEQYTGIVVAFTDGAISVPATMPSHLRGVLWAIWKQDCAPATWGDKVIVDKDGKTTKRA